MELKFKKAKNFFTEIKKTVYLWKKLWKEGTTALMRAPRSENKTAAALEIAGGIASSGREVLYINAEGRLDSCEAVDNDNLYVFTPEYESSEDTTDYADLVFEAIEQAVATTTIRTFVIDSISRMAALSFGRNASVAYLMKRIVALQVKHRLSILVLADDATKSVNNALSALAASDFSENSDPSDISSQIVESRPVLLRKRISDNATAKKQVSSESSECSENCENSGPSVKNRALCIEHRALKNLSRRERRALERKTTARFDRFAGPHMKRRAI